MKNTTSNTASNTKVIVLLAMLLLSGFGMFGQTAQPAAASINIEVAISGDNVSTIESNPNLNMISWLVGTKQTSKSTISNDGTVGKKQMINAGIAPNRLLIKAFLKKANDFQSTIA